MRRKIHLYGHLAEKFGDVFELVVANAGEAIRALHVNLPGFTEQLREGAYEIVRGEQLAGFHLDLEDINTFALGDKDLHIIPLIAGSKRGGLVKTILGVALIGTALFLSGGALSAPIGGGLLGGVTYGNLALAGLALTFAGVSQLLTPKPYSGNTNSSIFGNAPPTQTEGGPVPLVYGRFLAQGVVISSGLDVEQVPIDYSEQYPGQTFNYYDNSKNGHTTNGV